MENTAQCSLSSCIISWCWNPRAPLEGTSSVPDFLYRSTTPKKGVRREGLQAPYIHLPACQRQTAQTLCWCPEANNSSSQSCYALEEYEVSLLPLLTLSILLHNRKDLSPPHAWEPGGVEGVGDERKKRPASKPSQYLWTCSGWRDVCVLMEGRNAQGALKESCTKKCRDFVH